MNAKKITKPEIPESFQYGYITKWEASPSIRKDRGKYNYKLNLHFSSGKTVSIRKGGFQTKRMASKSLELAITQLNTHTFVPFIYTVREYYDYWLYYHMIDVTGISCGTFYLYRSIIYNYIVPRYGETKIADMRQEHITDILRGIPHASVVKQAIGMLGSSFKTAMRICAISTNPVNSAISMFIKQKKREDLYKLRHGEVVLKKPTSKFEMPSVGQICRLLLACKERYPQMFLPLLISFSIGTRISETLGLKYEDVDFTNHRIYINRQVGRSLDNTGIYDGVGCVQELRTKSINGVREIPAPDFLIDEIILARARYERLKTSGGFQDNGYICCKKSGIAFHRSSFRYDFRELLDHCNVSAFRWHDIRHIYATILKNNNVSLKAISVALGHSTEQFTEAVYIEKKNDHIDFSVINSFIKEVLPDNEATKIKDPETLSGYVCLRDAYNDYIKNLLKKPG